MTDIINQIFVDLGQQISPQIATQYLKVIFNKISQKRTWNETRNGKSTKLIDIKICNVINGIEELTFKDLSNKILLQYPSLAIIINEHELQLSINNKVQIKLNEDGKWTLLICGVRGNTNNLHVKQTYKKCFDNVTILIKIANLVRVCKAVLETNIPKSCYRIMNWTASSNYCAHCLSGLRLKTHRNKPVNRTPMQSNKNIYVISQ